MAFDFVPGDSDNITVADADHLDFTTNMTACSWAYADSYTGDQRNILKKDQNYILRADLEGVARWLWFDGSTIRGVRQTRPATGGWHHWCATVTSNVADNLYIDGSNSGQSTEDFASVGRLLTNDLGIGATPSTGTEGWDGRLCEIAMWDVVLTQAEVTALASGFSPLFIRPQSLTFYAPLVRELIDPVNASSFTNNGAAVIEHPRIIYPH